MRPEHQESAAHSADGDPERPYHVGVRENDHVRAGTLPWDAEDVITGWHSHDLHQIEYAIQGVVEVETDAAHFLLPPHRALWIPAGLGHTTVLRDVRTISVFFDVDMVPPCDQRARVLAIPPLIREMVSYATRWPISRAASDPTADAFFDALARLVFEWLDYEQPYSLPTSTDPIIRRVMSYTRTNLADICVEDLCRATNISERTLRRRFPADTGMTWRQYLLQSRLLRATALLTQQQRTVAEVATMVGFENSSSFARAFLQFTGETPSNFRRHSLDSQRLGAISAGSRPAVPAR